MKIKRLVCFLFVTVLLASMVSISAEATLEACSFDDSNGVNDVIDSINENFQANEFGGIYYDGDTLIINIVESENFLRRNMLMKEISSTVDVEYRMVKYSIQELEETKEFLTPVMNDFNISVLDANEITNQVDVFLKEYNEETIRNIEAYTASNCYNIEYLNFIDDGEETIVSTVAYEKPLSTFNIENIMPAEEKNSARTRYFSGAQIRIGNGYYTLGPALSSSKAYSAGHGFQGSASVYDSSGMLIGSARSYYGGASGDWSSVSIYSADYYPVVGRGDPIAGNRVYMLGATSGETSGSITKTNISISANAPYAPLTGMCAGNYRCDMGDSGGGIFSRSIVDLVNSSSGVTYGIQSAGRFSGGVWAGESYFTPISKVN